MRIMVEDPHTYFGQWIPERSDLLMALETDACKNDIPIVGPVVGKLLYLLAMLRKPRLIVELGTATGYSAIFMAEACRSYNGRLLSFEAEADMAAQAARNIEDAGLASWVDIQCRDAMEGIENIGQAVDMIFMDIEKQDYFRALQFCKAKLNTDGLLVADNTGFKDAHRFNQAIFEDPDWQSVNLWTLLPGHSPEKDGLCIAMKC